MSSKSSMVKIFFIQIFVISVIIRAPLCSSSQDVNSASAQKSKKAVSSDANTLFPGIALALTEQHIADKCMQNFSCNPSEKYRSIDGSCNNLRIPGWGVTNTSYVRLFPASYADGYRQVRQAQNGNPLPSPRLIRTELFPDKIVPESNHTLAFMGWGQFMAHDITAFVPKAGPPCCTQSGSSLPPQNLPPSCLPVEIPKDDTFFSAFNRTCMEMRRATTTEDLGCKLVPIHQIAQVTHYHDGSTVYGSNNKIASFIRQFKGGLLKTQTTADGRPFLPNVKNPEICNVKGTEVCYFAGDDRANVNTEIALNQIMFMRLHNYLASELNKLHVDWSDEVLFQETRRIVVAILQHITFNEYVPVLLGAEYTQSNNLAPAKSGYATGYNASINPSTISEFVAAAFRSFHSTVQGFIRLVSENRTVVDEVKLSDWINRPGDIIQPAGNYDNFLRGLITQSQREQDSYFTAQITNLFNKNNMPFGVDLLSFDINRGRDFGVPPYTKVRQLCGLSPVNSFDDLKDVTEAENIAKLSKLYSNVHDVDYLVGGLLEKKLPGSLAGPSVHCVTTAAFLKYKFADRFYYEFDGQPGSFTIEQLNAIRKFTYAMVICLTSDGIQSAQRNGFSKPDSQSNPLVPCSEIVSEFNLKAWAA